MGEPPLRPIPRAALRFSRLLLFDKRGSGLSDRTVDLDLFTLEVRIDDVRAVMEAAGSEQAVLFGHGDDGAALASVFAAANPDSTRALILYATRAKVLKAPDYPWGYEPSAMDVWASERESFWGTDGYARRWLRELAPRWRTTIASSAGTRGSFGRAQVREPKRPIHDGWPHSTCAACSRRSMCRRSCCTGQGIETSRSREARRRRRPDRRGDVRRAPRHRLLPVGRRPRVGPG